MKILRDPTRLTPCVLVLGMFDGVHRGHQALLMRGGELAQEMDFPLCVLSFEPHPLRVLAPHKAPPLLNTLPEKARIMQSFGVDYLSITTFNRARADQSPEDFMAEMVATYAPVVVVCGFNFTFGRGGLGNGKLTDRTGADFHLIRDGEKCRTVVLNGKKLNWLDRQSDLNRLGLWATRLYFTTENPREVDRVLAACSGGASFDPGSCTRGLYLRGVE